MMSEDRRKSTRECLGIAIDHRLQSKLTGLDPPQQFPSDDAYGSILEELLKLRMKPFISSLENHEYLVTTQLLRPTMIGGVIALLQQPANNHPFRNGLNAVADGSPTLRVLREVEHMITGLRGGMSILDSLPFIKPSIKLDDTSKVDVRSAVFKILQAKQPRVILCMWQDKPWVCGELAAFRSQGVGRVFSSSTCTSQIGSSSSRINAFHPSFMLRYGPDMSCLRQLLILEMTRAFAMCTGNWQNEPWMSRLRFTCQEAARKISARSRHSSIESR